MKRFPIYTQHESTDCGPTCLRMIAAYYGKSYSLSTLREKCYISKNGVSLLGISEAAEQIGFHARGIRFNVKQLIEEFSSPCILHWNQKHFVVLYRIKKKRGLYFFYIADPVGKKVIYTEMEFTCCWCNSVMSGRRMGVLLSLVPSPSFYEQKRENHNHNDLLLLSYLKPYKRLIFQLFLGLAVGSFFQIVLPFLTQSMVDYGIEEQNLSYIYLILLAQLAFTLGNTAIDFVRNWILLHIGIRINISLISDYLAKLMKLPIAFFDTKMTGDLLQRINDHSRIQNFLTNSGLFAVFSFVNIFMLGIIVLVYSWKIFLIYFVGTGFYVMWICLFMRKRANLDYKIFTQNSANQSAVIQLITGMQEIKLNACEQQKRWEWEQIQARIFKLLIKNLSLTQSQTSGATFINRFKNLIITAFVATLVVEGKMTLGMMLSIQYIIGQLNSPVSQLISSFRSFQDAQLSLERLRDIYSKEDEVPVHHHLITTIVPADIEMKNLSFKYDKLNAHSILQGINLTIPKGKTTAIVGSSGSGKTTLMKLLLGFYTPDCGEILVDRVNIQHYDKREWRKTCGVVMQDGFIFSDTIAQNIALSDHIDEKRLRNAIDTANIGEYIEALPLGIHTLIGANGLGLSQGQKQRILIARAVYKNPDYIFLDEATNSLDSNNERSISEKLSVFLKGKTAVIIAHRLSTVRYADQIVVLGSGCIKEVGTHEELLSLKGDYYSLVKNQLEI